MITLTLITATANISELCRPHVQLQQTLDVCLTCFLFQTQSNGWKPFGQPVALCKQTSNQLYNRLDTAGRPTGCPTGWTTGCIVVQPVVQPFLQPVVSCKHGIREPMTITEQVIARWMSFCHPNNNVRAMVKGKGKGFPYSMPSVGPGADPGVQAVSLQVTVSHPPVGRLPLLSARPAVTSQPQSITALWPVPSYTAW